MTRVWDPRSYLTFAEERGRSYGELLVRIGSEWPRTVVDLGCGPGNQTVRLTERWPAARVIGLDSSVEMIDQARQLPGTVEFDTADLRDWAPGAQVDVVLANSVLHWLPDHQQIVRRWVGQLAAGAWLAFQVPGNADAPSHEQMREVAADPRWADRLSAAVAPRRVPGPAGYAGELLAAGCEVDSWETTYLHLLPVRDGTHPVLAWLTGSALRPVRAALSDPEWEEFRQRLATRLTEAYPAVGDVVPLPFRRVFVVARVQ